MTLRLQRVKSYRFSWKKKKNKILDVLEQLCVHKSCHPELSQEPRLAEHFLLTIAIQLCLKSYGRAAAMKKP